MCMKCGGSKQGRIAWPGVALAGALALAAAAVLYGAVRAPPR